MKVIIKILSSFLLLVFLFGCEKIERDNYSNEDGRFVRFNFQVDGDGVPVDNSRINSRYSAVDSFNNRWKEPVAIPVSLTSEPLEEEVIVEFSTKVEGSYKGMKISPEKELRFNDHKLTDTIYVEFSERWDPSEENRIIFKLENVSDPEINIGNIGDLEKLDVFILELGNLNLSYKLTQNIYEINGKSGETFTIDVEFPGGFFTPDLKDAELFSLMESDFNYTLEQLPFNGEDMKISYRFTLEEDVEVDEFAYKAVLNINQIEGYRLSGVEKLTIEKPVRTPRDKSLNTASFFYNLDDPFHRIYGENWMDYSNDGVCSWRGFNTFTFPVVVDADHPDAVLYDDNGNDDPSDDIYHHAFRIGFGPVIAGTTVNSFNLKRWFNNESISEEKSPGFNIPQALEFFPDQGNSNQGGFVKVIEQDLLIASTDDGEGSSHVISISGEGTYQMISEGIYEIDLELKATNDELFGGTRISRYKFYNTDNYEDPVEISDACIAPMDL